MYSKFQLTKKYLHYYFTASNGKGHGIHSPFVFDFIINVLNDKKKYDCYNDIEKRRLELLNDATVIEVEDFGAGSSVIKTNARVVKKIARSSLKPKKFSQLLFRMVQYYQPKTIVELGTSFGITTAYLASGNTNAQVSTCEGAKNIAHIAKQSFEQLNLKNIILTEGDFTTTLPPLLNQLQTIDLAFVDGNHRRLPTLDYFTQLLKVSTPSTILIFDDIHWSAEMEAAWNEIKQHPAVTLTIDLFFIGIVTLNNDIKVKQHFDIRF
ncbi:O-methyltransferase [Ferruginibacter sp. SUN106]|uniref:O-methyltransferase n=1 Tax=Ferruginibacter sp. SUN106 TaxID=2978348 RepID=UPI003D36858D